MSNNVLVFILLWIGLILIIVLLNYKPRKKITKKQIKSKENIEPTELLEEIEKKVVVKKYKKPYIYYILGLIFLPLLTMFIAIFIIESYNIYAPYILVITNSFNLLLKTYEIISYIIIVETTILFISLLIKNKYIDRTIKEITKYTIYFSIVIFCLGLVADIINIF